MKTQFRKRIGLAIVVGLIICALVGSRGKAGRQNTGQIQIARAQKASQSWQASRQQPENLKSDQQDFIDAFLPYAKHQYQLYGVPVSVQLAQGAYESGWGQQRSHNSFFNITNDWHDPPTEVVNSPYTTTAVFWCYQYDLDGNCTGYHYFRSYDTAEKAWLDYGYFLKNDPNYASAWQHVGDPRQFLQDIFCIYTYGPSGNCPAESRATILSIFDNWTARYGADGNGGDAPNFKFPWDKGEAHKKEWTGGPHGNASGTLCLPYDISHQSGLDFGGGGWDVLASASGTVLHAGWLYDGENGSSVSGIVVALDHNGCQTEYLHLSEVAPGITPGTQVSQGQWIGKTGKTGTGAKGEHLHLELRRNGFRDAEGNYVRGARESWDGKTIDGWVVHSVQTDIDGNGEPEPGRAFDYKGTMTKGTTNTKREEITQCYVELYQLT